MAEFRRGDRGGVTPRAEIDALVAGLADHPEVAILSDEIYSQMSYDGLEHVSLLTYPSIRDRLILLDGWSKTYAMTGWRMGYSLWPKPWGDAARKLAVNSYSCVNAPAQFAGLAALTGPQDAVRDMGAKMQSTLIVFNGSTEKGRSTGVSDPDAIKALLEKTNP